MVTTRSGKTYGASRYSKPKPHGWGVSKAAAAGAAAAGHWLATRAAKKIYHSISSTQTMIDKKRLQAIIDSPAKLYTKKLTFVYNKRHVKGVTQSIKIHQSQNALVSGADGDQLINPGDTGFGVQTTLVPRYLTVAQIMGTSSTSQDDRPLLGNQVSLVDEWFSLFKANQSAIMAPLGNGTDAYINDQNPPKDQYLVIKNCDETLQVKNFTSTATTVQIYWFICKNNDALHPYNEITDELTDYVRGQSAASVLTSNSKSGYLVNPKYMPNYSPGNCKQWKNNWRMFHVESFVLESNEEVKFLIHHSINRVLSKDNIDENTGDYIPGLTVCPLVFANGALGIYEDTSCTQKGPKLGSFVTRHYEIGFLPRNVVAPPFESFNLRHARGTLVLKEMNPETDASVTITSA